MLVHLIPNSLAPLILAASLNVGAFIIAESAISFLGVGVSPPTASRGSMLAAFQAYLRYSAVAVLLPGGAIFITVMAINFVGDGLRDAPDPWLRNPLGPSGQVQILLQCEVWRLAFGSQCVIDAMPDTFPRPTTQHPHDPLHHSPHPVAYPGPAVRVVDHVHAHAHHARRAVGQ
jgi:hypothetical protein